MTSIGSCFSSISRDVNKFSGCFKQIETLEQSGKTHEDKIQDSLELYQATVANAGFKFLGCWRVLKDSAKWGAYMSKAKSTPNR